MGILDDAIREHLELKRRHGVPEDEVERQQEEALGPARRDVAQQPEEAEVAADAGDDTPLFVGEEERDAAVAEAPAATEPAPPMEEPLAPSEQPLAPAEPTAAEPPPTEAAPGEATVSEHPPAEAAFSSARPPEAEPPVADHIGMEPPPAEHEPDPHEALDDTEPHGFPALDEDDLHEDDAHRDDDSDDDPLPASDAEDEELDVLEDTPDFLQETTEHDRLWFEQKPPRDFDFD